MKFNTLIQKHTWLSVSYVLKELYPDEDKNLEGYQEVFEKLQIMQPKKSDMAIVIANCKDEFDGEEYVDVSGKHAKNIEDTLSYAIEFTPWEEWLGMDMHQDSLDEFTDLEIIAHCLYEMTFAGFEEEEIQDEIKRIKDITEDYKNMTDEEKEANITSLDDFLKDLESEDDESENE